MRTTAHHGRRLGPVWIMLKAILVMMAGVINPVTAGKISSVRSLLQSLKAGKRSGMQQLYMVPSENLYTSTFRLLFYLEPLLSSVRLLTVFYSY